MIRNKNKTHSDIPTPPEGYGWLYHFNDELYIKKSNGEYKKANEPGTSAIIPLSNTAYVNLDLAESNSTLRIFNTYASALAWIIVNGSPSADNLWQIILPAGSVGNVELSNKHILINCNRKTIIENLTSTIEYIENEEYSAQINDATINTYISTLNSSVYLNDCLILNVLSTPETAGYLFMNNCIVSKGTFNYFTDVTSWNSYFYSTLGQITGLQGVFHQCLFKSTEEFPISFKESSLHQLYSCMSFGNFAFLNLTLQMFHCHFKNTISLYGSVSLTAETSSFATVNCSIVSGTINTINLNESFIESLIGNLTTDVNVQTKGSSSYTQLVGDVDFADLNAADSTNVARIQITGAIPTGKYIDKLMYKVITPFLSYSGLTILDIKNLRPLGFTNAAGVIVVDDFSMQHSVNANLDIRVTLSGANLHNWTAGSFQIYAFFKSIPTL